MKSTTKRYLIKEVSRETGVDRKIVAQVHRGLRIVIARELTKHNKVFFTKFGSFKVVERREKNLLHPITRKHIAIPVRKHIKFIPSSYLLDAVTKHKT